MNKTILFDFDGVILDSFTQAYEVSFLIHPRMSKSEYLEAFEGNINDTISHTHKCDDDCKKEIDFFTEFVPRIKNQSEIFSGMPEVIKSLSKKYRLCIVSSTITLPIKELLDKFGLEKYFSDILGNDVHKSKVEKIKMILDKYKANKNDCLFVTDTLGDIKEASHVGVRSIGVSWGFHPVETLKKAGPVSIVNSPEELEKEILSYFGEV